VTAGDDDTPVLLELYKMAVEMADRVSARRAGANSFFLTLNTALAATVGIVSSAQKPAPGATTVPSFDAAGLVITAGAGIVLALVWRSLLSYYRRLNRAKFEVINALEQRLPAQPFANEWATLHPGEAEPSERPSCAHPIRRSKRWREHAKHREATVVEQVVPLVFVAIYIALAVRVLVE
jgi:hypothetical protein